MRSNVFFLLLLPFFALAQRPNVYNDDPFQKLPLGMEESDYHYREPDGSGFSEPRVFPPNWWTGMKNPTVEVLLYDQNIRDLVPTIADYAGVRIAGVQRLENPNYLFVALDIAADAQPGTVNIRLSNAAGEAVKSFAYPLLDNKLPPNAVQGVNSSDLLYLIMPDRFANGDPGNDAVAGTRSELVNRDKFYFRHGGDLIGIMEHLDYLEALGVTALWLNPVIENDQPYESYHGYAPTDHYRIDPRLGTNDNYRHLVQLAHARNMKVVMDVVFNHTGDQHWFIRDLPASDWIHQWKDGPRPIAYRAPVHFDPYGATRDFTEVTESWFDKHMPDLNLKHPQLANFLIQNAIWWTQYSGQDGFRIDTYAYCDQQFMAEWNRRLLEEFPNIGIFAETWVHGPGVQSWFTEGTRANGHNSHLPGVTDFQMYYALTEALTSPQSWTGGVARIYYTLAQDYLYKNPLRNVIFLDNHDLARISTVLNNDLTKWKSAMSLLLTQRGIPMLYYGTELMMQSSPGGGFGEGGRLDFPGGFPGDKDDKFKPRKRSEQEQAAFEHLQNLANYRKAHPVLQTGQLTQYIPQDGVYVYFRHNGEQAVMVAFNSNDQPLTLSTARFEEQLSGHTGAVNILTGNSLPQLETLQLAPFETVVLELAN